MALIRLADGNIGRRKIEDDGRTGKRCLGPRLVRGPEILANLDAENETGQILVRKQEVGTERYGHAIDIDFQPYTVPPMGEPALFVEFAIVREIAFRDSAEDRAACDDERAIVNPAIAQQRCTDDENRWEIPARFNDHGQLFLHRFEQRRLEVQIIQGVGGQAKFGKQHQVDIALRCQPGLCHDTFGIVRHVGRSHLGRTGRNTHETMRMPVVKGVLPAAHRALAFFLFG